jgi:hypothetical protein
MLGTARSRIEDTTCPLRFAGGDTNLYVYAGNDAVNLIDPTGLSWMDDLADWTHENASWIEDADAQPYANFFAGFGDTVSFGLSGVVRDWTGAGQFVDRCSAEYTGGRIAGHLWQIGMLRLGVQPGGWMNSNRYLRIGWSRKGGDRNFRVAGQLLRGKKWDIWNGGPL